MIAYVPSSVVNPCPDGTSPAWKLAGKLVPHVPGNDFGNPIPPDREAIIETMSIRPCDRIRATIA